VNLAFGLGIVERNGYNYICDVFPDGKVKGRDAALALMLGDEQIKAEIRKRVLQSALEEHAARVTTADTTTEENIDAI
jgi:hypothetical protein